MPCDIVRRNAEFLSALPAAREKQHWQDFTTVPTPGRASDAPPATVRGPGAQEFVTLLGLRADEPRRVDRIMLRTLYAEGASTAKCTVRTQPPGEHPYFPLYESDFTAEDVRDYWSQQDFDLDIPEGSGNCVFCFMKGTKNIRDLAQQPVEEDQQGTPSDVQWWADFEDKHARIVPTRDGDGTSRFGFFGVNQPSYGEIATGKSLGNGRYANGTPACDCTD